MILLDFLKKKVRPEKDFDKWIKTASIKALEKFCDKIGEGKEFDYTKQMWGHALGSWSQITRFVWHIHGFHGFIINTERPKAGSILLVNSTDGRIIRYMVLHLEFNRDPHDMFWAYIVGIGYKNTKP